MNLAIFSVAPMIHLHLFVGEYVQIVQPVPSLRFIQTVF
jgi:hypothetical protein